MTELAGKTAIVTGGSRGIGRAIVERLTADGAQVVFTFRREENAAAELAAKIATSGATAHAVRMDLGNVADVRQVFEKAEGLLGGLDILVTNAATNVVSERTTLAEVTEDDYDAMMNANAKGTFIALQEAARRLRDGGRIITVSTLNTVLPAPNNGLYQASKAAVELLTRTAAKELGGRGITANIVSPGATDTDLLRAVNPPERLAMIPQMTPLGRLGTPGDIAAVVAFLAGPDGGWITGHNIQATGGLP